LIPTGGLGEPFRWPGELVGPDVEGLAFGVALGGVGVGVGASDGSAGTGEMADRIAGCCVADEAAEDSAAAEEAGAEAWAAADVAVLAGPDPAAAELAAAGFPGA
jgi:hypothetical protein